MTSVGSEGRSYLAITVDDLKRLAEIARRDREIFFRKHPDWARLYQGRLLCTALCQGSALHYVSGKTGINDFDVWTFYRTNPQKPWCYRRNVPYDFGDPKFGKSIDRLDFVGRRVDCLGRDIEVLESEGGGVLGSPPSITFSGVTIAPSQTFTFTIPLVADVAHDYSGDITASAKMGSESAYQGFFIANTSITVTVLPPQGQ